MEIKKGGQPAERWWPIIFCQLEAIIPLIVWHRLTVTGGGSALAAVPDLALGRKASCLFVSLPP